MRRIIYILLFLLVPFASFSQRWPMWPGTGAPTGYQIPPSYAHFDASYAAGITIATGVSQWNDTSGNGRHMVQATAANQPAYSGTGTSSIITFDGVNDYLRTSTFTYQYPLTIYIVFKQITWTLFDELWDGFTATSFSTYQNSASPTFAVLSPGSAVFNITGYTLNTLNVEAISVSNIPSVGGTITSIIGTNSPTSASRNTSTTPLAGFTIGARGNGNAPSNIGVCEIILYNSQHTNTMMTDINQSLKTKWGIP